MEKASIDTNHRQMTIVKATIYTYMYMYVFVCVCNSKEETQQRTK